MKKKMKKKTALIILSLSNSFYKNLVQFATQIKDL